MTAAAPGQSISIAPIGGAMGAKVEGIDLARPLDEETVARLRQAFLDHFVLLFPGQGHITPAQQLAFARRWGEVLATPAPDVCHPDHPEILVIETREGGLYTDIWHSDVSMEPEPPLGSLLLAKVVPVGGDTIFSNQYLGYEALSEGMKRMLEGMRAWHTGEAFARNGGYDPASLPRNLHPVVRTHPETGRKALFVNPFYTTRFEDWTDEESRGLLAYLCRHAAQPNFTFRHQWRAGDLLMWDNRCLLHFAVADYGMQPRIMHRVTIRGDKPV